MKSSWFGNRKRYEFAKCLQSADSARHAWDLYPVWAECASIALQQACIKTSTGSLNDEKEARYMQLIGGVKNPKHFSEALAILTEGLEEEPCDFLGTVLGEWGILNKWAGQFFTPDGLCRLLADLSLKDMQPDPNSRFMANEPSCGSGATVIHMVETLKENGFNPWDYYVVAQDIDNRMFHSCYIQLTLLGVPATVINMNTLTLEEFDRATTLVGVLHPYRQRDEATCSPVNDSEQETTCHDITQGLLF